jgi:2-succinyl-6-hydroxy-2,4-cyclohexadiene-1-carboxylate synthase
MLMTKPHSAFIAAENIRLHYLEWDPIQLRKMQPLYTRDQDNDDIPLIMLHGLGATANTWNLLARHLCRLHLIVAFDLRGHGQSDQPASGYDLVTIAEDIVSGMAALGLGQVALVGHGWGARVALILAARHPALVSHLVLVDCPHVELKYWPGMTRERFIHETMPQKVYASSADFIQAMRKEMLTFWSPAVETIVRTYVRELPNGQVEERLRLEHQQQIREALWEDYALSYYSKLSCPVLLVPAAAQPQPGDEPPECLESADEFALAKGYMAAQVARTIQRCSVHWMPDTAHDIQLQHPQVLARIIANFVQNRL